jgi:D-alanyl-lipoteichoic acid acyltransferase DltB (MBOAT superfamily)
VKKKNILLLISSYFFYACWDYRFLFLLIFSTLLDFFSGIKISETNNLNVKRIWFWLSISINLGILGVLKYFNFFVNSFQEGLEKFGIHLNPFTLNILIPVGISFYTFHGLSYVIDIYKNRILPERKYIDYSLFVSYFPLLVAGPIERATHLLPQLKKNRKFDYAKSVDGLRQILWGIFKKVVIADNCAEYVNYTFSNYNHLSGSTLFLGALFFTFQIYCDFSGYSDVALGTSKLFGIDLLNNFSFPYFSRDIAEFWRRWHISLSSWFRDYLYIPLGGSKGGKMSKVRNTFIIFIVSGFWHGANWTFIFWGFLNALYFLPLLLFEKNRTYLNIISHDGKFPKIKELNGMIITFLLTLFAWIFFRSTSITEAFHYIKGMFHSSFFDIPVLKFNLINNLIFILILIIIEWIGRKGQFAFSNIESIGRIGRWTIYLCISYLIFSYTGTQQPFIYFQF